MNQCVATGRRTDDLSQVVHLDLPKVDAWLGRGWKITVDTDDLMAMVSQIPPDPFAEPPIAAGYQHAHECPLRVLRPRAGYPVVVASGTSTAFITDPLAISASAWFTSSRG
jgi:hypothetical protein